MLAVIRIVVVLLLLRSRHSPPLQIPRDPLIEGVDPSATIRFPRENERIRRRDLERARVVVVIVIIVVRRGRGGGIVG